MGCGLALRPIQCATLADIGDAAKSSSNFKIDPKSMKNQRNFDLGRFGRSGPTRGRSGTRPERPRDTKLGRLGRQVGRLGRQVGGSECQVGRLEQRVGPLRSLLGARLSRCQCEPLSKQRSKPFFIQYWDDRKKPEA